MFRGKQILILTGLSYIVISCTTSQTYRVDRNSEYVEVYSTNDKRSAMTSPAQDRSIQQSIDQLKAKVKTSKADTQSWLNLAYLYAAQGKLAEAEYAAKKALRHDIKNQEAKKVLAQVALKRGQLNLAEILTNSLGGERSEDSQVLNLVALIALERNKPSKAMDMFKKSLNRDPGNITARMNLGVSYLKYRQLSAAAVQFERVLKVMPSHADALLHLAIIKAAKGDLNDAEDKYETVLAGQRNNPIALYNLAVLQKNKEDYGDAINNLKIYLKNPNVKSSDSEEVFALIEKIKDLQQQSGSKGISDSEIETLAINFKNQKRTKTPNSNTIQDRDLIEKKPASSINTSTPLPVDAEIDELERALIE